MQSFDLVPPYLYSTWYHITLVVLCWVTVLYHVGSNDQKILRSEGSSANGAALVLGIIVTLYLGLRPVTGDFVDMRTYAYGYNTYIAGHFRGVNLRAEWFWSNIIIACKKMGLNVNEYFLVIEIGYIGCVLIAARLLMRANMWIVLIFFLTAFQFYNFGTNGIRNGLACNIELVALALIGSEQKGRRVIAIILMIIAMGTHRSAILPTAAAFATLYVVKDTKWGIRFWLMSIPISLAVGPFVEQLIVSLGFDNRMAMYSGAGMSGSMMSKFSRSGFRWDFLLYSSFPVFMIWYVTRVRRFTDKTYTILANAYLLGNAFWIMVIRAAFSNRFAYLSWFLYPVIFAYPLMRMNLWKDQDRKTALILFGTSGFTFFMFFIYYFGTSGFKGFDLYWWK